jgi:hypothetical protein
MVTFPACGTDALKRHMQALRSYGFLSKAAYRFFRTSLLTNLLTVQQATIIMGYYG